MKNKITFCLLLFYMTGFGQKIDSTLIHFNMEIIFEKNNVDFNFIKEYDKVSPNGREFIPSYKIISCMFSGFYSPIENKKHKDHYEISFQLLNIGIPYEEGSFMKKINPNYTPNTNYLGGINCKIERDKNLMNLYTKSDFLKFNADTALCVRVDSNAKIRDNEKYKELIYVVIHKDDVADIFVCFAYEKEYEFEVIEEIKNLWKIIKFK